MTVLNLGFRYFLKLEFRYSHLKLFPRRLNTQVSSTYNIRTFYISVLFKNGNQMQR